MSYRGEDFLEGPEADTCSCYYGWSAGEPEPLDPNCPKHGQSVDRMYYDWQEYEHDKKFL